MHIFVNNADLFVDVDGPELTVLDGSLRRRQTVIVLHGGPGFDQGYLRQHLAPLAGDAQLVFVDLRGQGRSGRVPVESCTLEQMADDVAALCVELGLTRPVVLGHSAGGFVALHLVVRHPQLAGGLILCHTAATLQPEPGLPGPPGPAERGGPQAATAAARLFSGDLTPEAGEAFNELVLPLYAAPGHEDIPTWLMARSDLNAEIAAHFFLRLAPRYDLRPQLPTIDIPALVVVGGHDWVCPPAAGRTLASGIPDARLAELADAGHFGFAETPTPFLAAVRSYLAELSDAQPLAS